MPKGVCNNKNHMANLRKPTHEEAVEMGRKSQQVQKAKRTMQQEASWLLDLALYDGKPQNIEEIQSIAAMKGKNISVRQAILIAQLQKALKGDTTAASYVMNASGEKPAEKIDIGPTFEDYVKNHKVKM